MGLKICMFVYNPFRPDVRVLKEARTLTQAGHRVTVIAVQDKDSLPEEKIEGVRVVRWARDPLHHRTLRYWRRLLKGAGSRGAPFRLGRAWTRGAAKAIRLPLRRLRKYRLIGGPARRFRRYAIDPALQLLRNRRKKRKKLPPLHRRVWRGVSKYRIVGGPARRIRWYVIDPIARRLPQRAPCPLPPVTAEAAPPPADAGPAPEPQTLEATDVQVAAQPPPSNPLPEPRRASRLKKGIDRALAPVQPALHALKACIHWQCCFRDFERGAEQIIGQDRYDIFHAHDLNTLPVAHSVARQFGGKLVYDSHELYAEVSGHSRFERKMWMRMERRLIHDCDAVITVCESIADELQNRYGVQRPTVLLNAPPAEAADDGHDLFRETLNVPRDVPVVLYQGGYSPNRGLENLVTAATKFERGVLVMMGWGKIEQKLKDLARTLGVAGRVLFIPPVTQDVLLRWTGSADVGVIPYRFVGLNNYYSCPNKLFEYINAGVAIAGSAFPEISRFINSHGLGVTFDPDDPDDIARAVNQILADPQKHQQMRANARQARRVLNWDHESAKLLETYGALERLVNRKPGGNTAVGAPWGAQA